MDHDTLAIAAADEKIDGELGWNLAKLHDAQAHAVGFLDYWDHEFNEAMAYSPAYCAGWDAAQAEDVVDAVAGYYESTRPDWF